MRNFCELHKIPAEKPRMRLDLTFGWFNVTIGIYFDRNRIFEFKKFFSKNVLHFLFLLRL